MHKQNPYAQKVNDVITYIKEHISEELTVDTLSNVANLSPFHFHRIFKSLTGETLYDAILRLRMERAAILLSKHQDLNILNLALDLRFSNSSAFTRAFKRYFGFTPSDVQQNRDIQNSKIGILKSKYGKDLDIRDLYVGDMLNKTGVNKMNVEIKNLDKQYVVYLTANLTHEQSMSTWLKLNKWYHENKGTVTPSWNCIGKYFDDPSVTPEDKCVSHLCLVVTEDVKINPPFGCSEIPKGKYAFARYTIKEEHKDKWTDKEFKADDMNIFIQNFYKNWMIGSGYESDNYPLMMQYKSASDMPLKDANGNEFFDVEWIDVIIKLKE